MSYESNGENFNEKVFLLTRDKTIEIVEKVASLIEVGMNEDDGLEIIDHVMNEFGVERKWHPNKFRIGENTLKSFREKSERDILLKKNDIFFLDIGPVINGHEGDFGKTFQLGQLEKYQNVIDASERVFRKCESLFKENSTSGGELYDYARKITQELGYELNLDMAGHRLGDFPHAIHFKGKLSQLESIPSSKLWVLEILIKHPEESFGAFYEDIIFK